MILKMVKLRARQANNWRLKFEKEGVAKIEELESTKMKLQVLVVMMVMVVMVVVMMMVVLLVTIRSPCWC